jgi:hypothetical protein
MRVAIHQPEYLGYLGFYNKMMNADAWVFLDNVQLAKRDFVRRNRIHGPNGAMWLSVPIITKGRYYQLIQDVEIDKTKSWEATHWRSIEYQYRRTPFFERYAQHLAPIYESEWFRVADLNIRIVETMARLLGVERPTYLASELGITGNSSQLLADLTTAVGGDVYLSGPMGRDYLEMSIFRERGLQVEYNDFVHPSYPQQQGREDFIPYLAAIDLLFNCGPAARDVIAEGNPSLRVGSAA